jgi:hypothetical protein
LVAVAGNESASGVAPRSRIVCRSVALQTAQLIRLTT